MTQDYEQIGFMLVLRQKRAAGRDSLPRYGVETRSIKVHRRNVSTVHLRVLKRFAFTERDADPQWDKLEAAFTYAMTAGEFFNNRALFSDYYLTQRVPDSAVGWKQDDQARYMAREAQRLLVDARAELANQPRAVIWTKFYEPLFKDLHLKPEQVARGTVSGATTCCTMRTHLTSRWRWRSCSHGIATWTTRTRSATLSGRRKSRARES